MRKKLATQVAKTFAVGTMATVLSLSMEISASAKTVQTNLIHNVNGYVNDYVNEFIRNTQNTAQTMGSLSGLLPWYENTGTTIPEGYTPDYTNNQLLEVAQVGDIIYEAKGGYGVTGHIGIVEGKFYDEASGTWYIRFIESTAPGVIRSILEQTCVDEWEVHLLRVNDATDEQKQKAVEFCISQLGSSYNLDFAHDTSEDEEDWYCSELVWAAYYNLGIDIETTGLLNEPGITPRDIARSSKVTEITF